MPLTPSPIHRVNVAIIHTLKPPHPVAAQHMLSPLYSHILLHSPHYPLPYFSKYKESFTLVLSHQDYETRVNIRYYSYYLNHYLTLLYSQTECLKHSVVCVIVHILGFSLLLLLSSTGRFFKKV